MINLLYNKNFGIKMVNYQDYTEMHGQQKREREKDFFMFHITNYKVYSPFRAAGSFSASQEINQI